MASLSLTFPEKDQPTVIALTGARLTIGRLPFNTIQIIDRTVSGFHAELISEHGHYRLHDRGSSNGTFVNGQKIADYHLNDACTITFGTVEAQFSPEAVPASEEAESFPTRSEINAVRQENADLRATVAALREETNALRQARPAEGGDAALVVGKDAFDKVVAEREKLKEERLAQEEEMNRIRTDLAVLKRDRVNLQLAYDAAQRELVELRAKAGGGEAVALTPQAAAVALASQVADTEKETPVEVPAVAKSEEPGPKPEEPAAPAPEPAAEIVPEKSATESEAEPEQAAARANLPPPVNPLAPKAPAAPPASLPKVPGLAPKPAPIVPKSVPPAPRLVPPPNAKPFAPLPKAPAIAAGAAPSTPDAARPVPAKAPTGLGSGVRPVARPASSGENATPLPKAPLAPGQPPVKATLPPKAGPKGTQKIG